MKYITKLFKNYPLFFHASRSYIAQNRIESALGIYLMSGLLLKSVFQTDIFVPCLWSTVFGVRCPGCGMTRACIQLLSFDFPGAYHSNPLSFVVFPAIAFYLLKDFLKHLQRNLFKTF